MEAGPRDTAPGAERVTTEGDRADQDEGPREDPQDEGSQEDLREDLVEGPREGLRDDLDDGLDDRLVPEGGHPLVEAEAEERLADDGPDEATDGVTEDGPAPEEMYTGGPEVEVELRPQRRLRIWQLAPIVGLSAVGSLMFAFPLAFDGDSGAVIAMLGLLICCCAAGWGMMAARRVGYTWPGLPPRGSGRRPDWRVVLGYALLVAVVAVLAVWRVARLR
ncbi:membrane protein [Streptomyces sp. S816]|nr:membrane protein [Streptomyces sp. S816]